MPPLLSSRHLEVVGVEVIIYPGISGENQEKEEYKEQEEYKKQEEYKEQGEYKEQEENWDQGESRELNGEHNLANQARDRELETGSMDQEDRLALRGNREMDLLQLDFHHRYNYLHNPN